MKLRPFQRSTSKRHHARSCYFLKDVGVVSLTEALSSSRCFNVSSSTKKSWPISQLAQDCVIAQIMIVCTDNDRPVARQLCLIRELSLITFFPLLWWSSSWPCITFRKSVNGVPCNKSHISYRAVVSAIQHHFLANAKYDTPFINRTPNLHLRKITYCA